MIPQFPVFKDLKIEDKEEIEKITKLYPPYSDFNFTSLWSWDVESQVKISILNGNLIIRFSDYITNDLFYSFIGSENIENTVAKLLDLSEKEGLNIRLNLIPEESVQKLSSPSFNLEEDRDNFDYIYTLEKIIKYDGNRLRSRRNLFNRFKNKYISETIIINPSDIYLREMIYGVFRLWAENKKLSPEETKNELLAINRVLNLSLSDRNIVIVGLLDGKKMIGFVINELVHNDTAILHFEKADENYIGVYSYLMSENARILHGLNRTLLNYEQDLGIPGLRLGKKAYRPLYFLKKYRLSID